MKFPHCGKLSKRSGRNGKHGANSAERTIRTSSKAESFAKSVEKNWFVIGKVMVRCIFTVHLAMFQFQRKTSGTALTRSCTSGWKNQSLLLSGKLDTVLANVEEQAVERYEVLIEQLSRREHVSEKLKEENQMEWVRRMRNLENRAEEIVKAELIYTFEGR